MRIPVRVLIGAASAVLAAAILLVVLFRLSPGAAPLRAPAPAEPAEARREAPVGLPRPAPSVKALPAPGPAREVKRAPVPTDPFIRIDAPADGIVYHSSLLVSGMVADSAGSKSAREIGSLSWTIPEIDRGGFIPHAPDGSFSITVPLEGVRSDITLAILARKTNGRTVEKALSLVDDGKGPELTLSSPRDDSQYGSRTTIQGSVGELGELASLSWSLAGTGQAGVLKPAADGSFAATVPLAGLHGELVFEVRAVDRNGRVTAASRTVRERTEGPLLEILSPADGSLLSEAASVEGRAGDPRDPASSGVKRLSWRASGRPELAGDIVLSEDGRFGFPVPALDPREDLVLEVTAADENGHSSVRTLTLLRAPTAPAISPSARDSPQSTPPLSLAISAPPDGGYYQEATIVEGRVGDESPALPGEPASLSWRIPARADLAGHAVVNADGSFKLALPFSDLNGDVTVALAAEDKRGRFTQRTLILHDGRKKPDLRLSAPRDGSQYGSLIRVSGRVTDPYAGTPRMEGIQSLSWLVAPADYSRHSTPVNGAAVLRPDNSFRFSVPTSGLAGLQQLTVTARAANGNVGEITLRLVPGEGDVPGFAADPADRRVSVSWQEVPFATRYDLTCRPAGGPAAGGPAGGGRTITRASTPCVVTGLDNGSLYELHLDVRFDDGTTGSSNNLRAIPLAPETLAPAVTGEYQRMRLSWKTIPGAPAYDVWRSTSRDGGLTRIASSLSAQRYEDTAVEFGREYFYAIGPSGDAKAPLSARRSGKTSAFPEDKLALIGTVLLDGARRVTIQGGYAFVAAGARGVAIVDVSDPKSPVVVGRVATRDARHVIVRGDYALVADADAGLRVLDVSNPRAPEIIGSCKTSDAQAVAVSGSHAFVADGEKGLKVIDVSDARNPVRAAVVEATDARDVAVSGRTLFLADGAGGMAVFDLARPLAPSRLGSYPAEDARGVAVQAGTAVVACGAGGLRIVDAGDPTRPKLASTFETGMAASVACDGRFVYLVDEGGVIKVIDIRDPARPSLFTAHPARGAVSVAVSGGHAYLAGAAGLEIMKIQIYGRSFRVASCDAGGKGFGVTVSGDWAYVAAHDQGVRVVNVKDPSQVTGRSAVALASTTFAESVTVQDRLALVADGSGGIRILDVSPAWSGATPLQVGAYRTGGSVSRVAVSGTLACAANGDLGLRILDISDPARPSEVGSLPTRDAHDVAVHKGVAWVADGDSGLLGIDLSDPGQPRPVAAPVPGSATALALSGDLLLVAGAEGVRIFDVSDPRAPRLQGRYESPSVVGLASRGRYASVAEGYRGLTVLDVSNPAEPVIVSSCPDVFAMSVATAGEYALIADSRGLQVVRILIPEWLSR